MLGAADFDDGVPGWFFSRRWGGLETDLVDGRRRGGDGDPGDFLLNCSMSEHREKKEVSISRETPHRSNEKRAQTKRNFSLFLDKATPLLSGFLARTLFWCDGENFIDTPRVKEPKRPPRARRSQRIGFNYTVLIQNHRARSPRSIPRHSQTAISERENAQISPRKRVGERGRHIECVEKAKFFVNATPSAQFESHAYLCCSSTRSERSSRLTRRIATQMPWCLMRVCRGGWMSKSLFSSEDFSSSCSSFRW